MATSGAIRMLGTAISFVAGTRVRFYPSLAEVEQQLDTDALSWRVSV